MTNSFTIDLAELGDEDLERLVATGIGDHSWFAEPFRVAQAARDELDLRAAVALLGIRQASWPSLATVRSAFGRRDRLLLTALASIFRISWSGATSLDDGCERAEDAARHGFAEAFEAATGDGAAEVLEAADEIGVPNDADRPDDARRGGVTARAFGHREDGHRQSFGDGRRFAGDVGAAGEAAFEEGPSHDASG